MNHRERIMRTIKHQEPDRIPVDLGGMRSTGIMAMSYAALKQHLKITGGDIKVFDTMQQLAYVEEPIRKRFGADVVILDGGLIQGWKPYTLPDGTSAKIRGNFLSESDGMGGEYALNVDGIRTHHRPQDCLYFDTIYHPLEHIETIDDLKHYKFDSLTDEYLAKLQKEAKRLYEETDYAILGSFGGAFLESGQGLRGWANFMMDIAGDRPFAEALLARILEQHLRNVDLYLDAVGDYIQIIQMGGDLGTQAGSQLRPQLYYEMIQPLQKALWGRIHDLKPDVAVFLHCCGGIYDLIPGIIDAGCDALNPVQTNAKGMDPVRLKQEFGDKLCFWGGGCDTQHVLPFGTPEEVYEDTRRNIEIFKPDGGFVFCQIHNLQAQVPPENILAMYKAVQDYGSY